MVTQRRSGAHLSTSWETKEPRPCRRGVRDAETVLLLSLCSTIPAPLSCLPIIWALSACRATGLGEHGAQFIEPVQRGRVTSPRDHAGRCDLAPVLPLPDPPSGDTEQLGGLLGGHQSIGWRGHSPSPRPGLSCRSGTHDPASCVQPRPSPLWGSVLVQGSVPSRCGHGVTTHHQMPVNRV